MSDGSGKERGPAEASSTHAVADPVRKPDKPLRFSAKTKSKIVVRLLRGEDLELLSREFGTTAAQISKWRDEFLRGGEAAMKRREEPESDEVKRLREKLGELTMEGELLREKIKKIEAGNPLLRRRSRK
jgi:transposase-like protein